MVTSSTSQGESSGSPANTGVLLLVPPSTPHPRGFRAASLAYQTPQRRSNGSNVSSAAKRKLGTVAPIPGRCLITGAPEPYEVCHILPKATPVIQLFHLERAWDPKNCIKATADKPRQKDYFILNVNTTRNLIYLTPTMHTLFDQNKWALVPAPKILAAIFDRLVMNQPDGFHLHPEDSECSYMFVPLEYTLAFLQYGLDDKPIATHTHPFTSLPLIRSHIHPYFAICNTAEKVASLGQAKIDHLDIPIDMRRALNQCKLIYNRWMPSKPTKQRSVPNQSNSLPPKPSDPKPKPSNTSAGTNRDTPFGSQPSGRWMRSQRRGDNTPPTSDGHGHTKRYALDFRPPVDSMPPPEEFHYDSSGSSLSGGSSCLSCDYSTRIQAWVADMTSNHNLEDPNSNDGDHCLELYSSEPSRNPMPGSWSTWKPSWTQSLTVHLYDDMDRTYSFRHLDSMSDSGCKYAGRAASIC